MTIGTYRFKQEFFISLNACLLNIVWLIQHSSCQNTSKLTTKGSTILNIHRVNKTTSFVGSIQYLSIHSTLTKNASNTNNFQQFHVQQTNIVNKTFNQRPKNMTDFMFTIVMFGLTDWKIWLHLWCLTIDNCHALLICPCGSIPCVAVFEVQSLVKSCKATCKEIKLLMN